jgi:hypothetical protein
VIGRLSVARLTARPGRAALVAGGIAVAVAFLLATHVASLVVRDQAVRNRLVAVGPAARAVTVIGEGHGASYDPGAIGAGVERDLGRLGPVGARVVLYGEVPSTNSGRIIVGGIDALRRHVVLTDGRWPRVCDASRCEVVQVTLTSPSSDTPGLGLTVVGRAHVTDPLVFAGALDPGITSAFRAPVLVADGVDRVASLPALADFQRVDGWVVPIDPAKLRVWQVRGVLDTTARAQGRIGQGVRILAPSAILTDALTAGDSAARRLQVVGVEAAAALGAFLLLAAHGFRRDIAEERARLRLRGARQWQQLLFVTLEATLVALAGVVAGVAIAVVAGAALARRQGIPALECLTRTLATPSGGAIIAACAIAAAAIVTGIALAREAPSRRFGAMDAVAAVAVAGVLLAVARGTTTPTSLAHEDDPLPAILPVLAALAAGVIAARLLPPAARAAARRARRLPFAMRLAVLALGRSRSLPAIACGCLVVAGGLALFAQSYRASLIANQRAQAAYAVPTAATLATGRALIRPAELLSPAQLRARGAEPYSVIRRSASVAPGSSQVREVTALGVPAPALQRVDRWRSDFGGDPHTLAERLAWRGARSLTGIDLPATATSVTADVAVAGDPVDVQLIVQGANESVVGLDLGIGGGAVTVPIPRAARGGRVIGISVVWTGGEAIARQGLSTKGGQGTASIRGLTAIGPGGGTPITGVDGWNAPDLAVQQTTSSVEIRYALNQLTPEVAHPRQPADGRELPAIVDRATAARASGGVVLATVAGVPVRFRVAAVAERFPTLQGGFIVADETALGLAVNSVAPGSALPGEIWLAGHPREPALRAAPFDALDVAVQADVLRHLTGDPLAGATLAALLVASLIAGLLGAAGVALVVLTDLRDERTDLYDLEVQGVPPSTLRRILRLRAAIVVIAGLAGAIALGALLTRWTVSVIHVTATGATPQPPLGVVTGVGTLAALVAAYLVLLALVVAAVTGSAFREATPRPPSGAPA